MKEINENENENENVKNAYKNYCIQRVKWFVGENFTSDKRKLSETQLTQATKLIFNYFNVINDAEKLSQTKVAVFRNSREDFNDIFIVTNDNNINAILKIILGLALDEFGLENCFNAIFFASKISEEPDDYSITLLELLYIIRESKEKEENVQYNKKDLFPVISMLNYNIILALILIIYFAEYKDVKINDFDSTKKTNLKSGLGLY